VKERGTIGRLGGYAEEVAAAVRRRRETRRPRVRVRLGHGEATVLDDDAQPGARLLELAQQLVAEERRSAGRG
jgi:hypothetical protein